MPDFEPYAAGVSWTDAVAYCEWLSAKEGKPYRLPTEARVGVCLPRGHDNALLIRHTTASARDAKCMGNSQHAHGRARMVSRLVRRLS